MLPAALFFCAAADLPHVLLVVIGIYAAALFRRKPLELSDRSIIYTVTLTLVLTVLGDYVFPLKNDRFGFLSLVLHPEWVAPALLYGASLTLFFQRREAAVGYAATAALAALAFGGDLQNFTGTAERLPEFSIINRNFPVTFPTTAMLTLAAMLGAFQWLVRDSGQRPKRSGRVRGWVTGGALLLIPLLIYGGFSLYQAHRQSVRSLEQFILRSGMRQLINRGGGTKIFGHKQVNLNTTLQPGFRNNESNIVLTALGKEPPGYLRGRVFSKYDQGSWSVEEEKESRNEALAVKRPEGLVAESLFYFDTPDTGNRLRFDVYLSGDVLGNVLYHPGGTAQISAIADRVEVTPEAGMELTDFVRDGGYRLYAGRGEALAYPADGMVNPALRTYPKFMAGVLRDEIEAAGVTDEMSDRQIFARLAGYLREHYAYSLDFKQQPGDPIVWVLTKGKQGHCELFATSLVLMLRSLGIPARYVTGFVCNEPHLSGSAYVARVGNAHAWVEAFDRQNKRWEMLEPTPASPDVPTRSWEKARQYGEWMGLLFKRLLADLRRGLFGQVIVTAMSGILGGVWLVVSSWWMLPVWAWLIWRTYRRWKRRQQERLRNAPDEEKRRMIREYRRLLKRMRKQKLVKRDEEPTARELSKRVQDETLKQWLRDYEWKRYRT